MDKIHNLQSIFQTNYSSSDFPLCSRHVGKSVTRGVTPSGPFVPTPWVTTLCIKDWFHAYLGWMSFPKCLRQKKHQQGEGMTHQVFANLLLIFRSYYICILFQKQTGRFPTLISDLQHTALSSQATGCWRDKTTHSSLLQETENTK